VAMSGLLAHAGAQEETIAAYTQEMTEFINAQMSQNDIKGLSIAVVYGDQAVFVKGFGEADQGVPVDANTTFRLGSVAKVFTGMAAMQLVEQGLIDLDAPLTDYLPEFSVRYHVPVTTPITIRHLMTHQSGLPAGKAKDVYSATPVEHFRELLAYTKDQYAAYPPEYMSSYSNLAVNLLGIVIERVSGQPFESYMQERMFAPLTMSSSYSGYPAAGSEVARPYGVPFDAMNLNSGNTYHDVLYISDTPSADIWSSAADMSLFLRMLLAGGHLGDREIVAEDTLKRMFEVQNSQLPLDFASSGGQRWGLSWILYPLQDPGGMMIGHGGTTGFYHAFLNFVPAYDVGVLVCSNTAHAFSTMPAIGLHGLETAVAMFHGENFAFAPPGEIPPVAPCGPKNNGSRWQALLPQRPGWSGSTTH
ncbi:MAG: beta-lactamase family protein, partial [Proteobacteria bacterium]|nr:beta-lactamase family protein [Pseudomonadota bacterium]